MAMPLQSFHQTQTELPLAKNYMPAHDLPQYMAVCMTAITKLERMLGPEEARAYVRLAEKVDQLENIWRSHLSHQVQGITQKVINDLMTRGEINEDDVNILPILMELYFSVSFTAVESTFKIEDYRARLAKKKRPPKGIVAKTLADVRRLYDKWRLDGTPDKRQKSLAEKWKQHYLRKVKQAWRKYSKPFREGDVFTQTEVREQIQEAARTTFARARTIVETETTRHWNQVRRSTYDELDEISHYLFMPIRDFRTTKWCKTRDGLVYKKGSVYLEHEQPPCHWNCRSEIIPLSPLNPRHKAMIEDESKDRENRRPEPLPAGWNR